jgi:hypothetical protein
VAEVTLITVTFDPEAFGLAQEAVALLPGQRAPFTWGGKTADGVIRSATVTPGGLRVTIAVEGLGMPLLAPLQVSVTQDDGDYAVASPDVTEE